MTSVSYLERPASPGAATGDLAGRLPRRPRARATGAAPATQRAAASGDDTRMLDAALACIARWGVGKTSLEDVAREARCSRATVYRSFPGGKQAVLEAVVTLEIERFFTTVGDRLAHAEDLEDLLISGIIMASSLLERHAALGYLLEHEPEVLLPRVAFDEMDRVFAAVDEFAAPYLARWMAPEEAGRVAEWLTRIVVSYSSCPGPGADLTDPSTCRRLVADFVLPALREGSTSH